MGAGREADLQRGSKGTKQRIGFMLIVMWCCGGGEQLYKVLQIDSDRRYSEVGGGGGGEANRLRNYIGSCLPSDFLQTDRFLGEEKDKN